MKKFARTCEGTQAGLGCPARGARFRTLANLYLCAECYAAWLVVHREA